jgi:hypothetical protein
MEKWKLEIRNQNLGKTIRKRNKKIKGKKLLIKLN